MLLNKIRDFMDTNVCMVILMDNLEQLSVLADVIVSIGRNRCNYEVYKNDITAYMMELWMPYNRYLAMMKGLRTQGWNLKPESKADIFNRMVKNWPSNGSLLFRNMYRSYNEKKLSSKKKGDIQKWQRKWRKKLKKNFVRIWN